MKRLVILGVILMFLCPGVFATQEHDDPEGLYSHQIAHIFFILSMVILIIQIRRTSPLSRGWKYVGISSFIFLLWNLDTFTVHWIREYIPSTVFAGSSLDWSQTMDVTTTMAKAYYLGKVFDHIFLVGAMVVFLMGIRAFKDREEGP